MACCCDHGNEPSGYIKGVASNSGVARLFVLRGI
jgi:hypothetical protein